MRHAVIMAGGRGERFWPLSRRLAPKQLLRIVGEESMIRKTVDRLKPMISEESIWVVTNQDQAAAIRKLLPEIPSSQIIPEPVGRNTAPCIALAAAAISRRDPQATMVVLPADHIISPKKEFHRTIRACCRAAEKEPALITIGIKPTFPATGYGYIKRGRKAEGGGRQNFYRVERFIEKPERDRAVRFCESNRYTWNSGIFIWTVETILAAFKRYLPSISRQLAPLGKIASDKQPNFLKRIYPSLPSISIDYGIMEKADLVLVTAATFKWDDVGSWESLQNYLPKDKQGNQGRGEMVSADSSDCIAFSDGPLIGMVGVSNLIVVSTEDAVLVCDRNRAQDVKKLVKKLARKKGYEKYL